MCYSMSLGLGKTRLGSARDFEGICHLVELLVLRLELISSVVLTYQRKVSISYSNNLEYWFPRENSKFRTSKFGEFAGAISFVLEFSCVISSCRCNIYATGMSNQCFIPTGGITLR